MRQRKICYLLVVLFGCCLLGLGSAQAGDGEGAFFMFTTSRFATVQEGSAVAAVLTRYLRPTDYLSTALVRQEPVLASARHYLLASGLAEVTRALGGGCADPDLIIYDGEHWSATPQNEQMDMPAAIARGSALASQTGCHKYGAAPDGEFIGVVPDRCTFQKAAGIVPNIDWRGVALFDIQAQVLLNDRCSAGNSVESYVNCVTGIARIARAIEHSPLIVAQLSLRDTPPDRMREAIRQLIGIVDGFYIAYPNNGRLPCRYCSPDNLAAVLQSIRAGG